MKAQHVGLRHGEAIEIDSGLENTVPGAKRRPKLGWALRLSRAVGIDPRPGNGLVIRRPLRGMKRRMAVSARGGAARASCRWLDGVIVNSAPWLRCDYGPLLWRHILPLHTHWAYMLACCCRHVGKFRVVVDGGGDQVFAAQAFEALYSIT